MDQRRNEFRSQRDTRRGRADGQHRRSTDPGRPSDRRGVLRPPTAAHPEFLQQCATIATQLTSLAGKIDTVHAAILDLLSRICNPLTGIKEVWEFLTDDDEDEIRKIANDIRIIVNQFTAEVDALRQEIATALSEADVIISAMARYAEKEWDHFLHAHRCRPGPGSLSARSASGVFTEAEGLVKGFWTLTQREPSSTRKASGTPSLARSTKLESLTGLEGEQRLKESWKELGKDTVHWDEWSINPFKAAGESAFDLGDVAPPGWRVWRNFPWWAARGGRRGGAQRASLPAPGRLPEPAPHDNPPPRNEPPKARTAGSPHRSPKARCHRMGSPSQKRRRPEAQSLQRLQAGRRTGHSGRASTSSAAAHGHPVPAAHRRRPFPTVRNARRCTERLINPVTGTRPPRAGSPRPEHH